MINTAKMRLSSLGQLATCALAGSAFIWMPAHATPFDYLRLNTGTQGPSAPLKPGKHNQKATRSPSEETKAERDRRLYRECKGLPNAGACRGYTQR